MTRLSNDLRNELRHKIMKDLPSKNYIPDIHALVQRVVIAEAPAAVRVMYEDPKQRCYLRVSDLQVSVGNSRVFMWEGEGCDRIVGYPERELRLNLAEGAVELEMGRGKLRGKIIAELASSGLVKAYFDQRELRDKVSKRVQANLAAAKTIKQLYTVLEPELHHYIPKDEHIVNLPSTVTPVVDDLRKLGANLPEVPKAAG